MPNDMHGAIVPKSDQLNSDDLIDGPRTIKITRVAIKAAPEQPVSVFYEGDGGKPYKPSKGMCRLMVHAWGADSAKYAGRSMTLFREPTVKWGGLEVGGIRISHMSHIEEKMTVALTMSKGSRKPVVVKPLSVSDTKPSPSTQEPASAPPDAPTNPSDPTATPGSAGEIAARKKAADAYNNASMAVRAEFDKVKTTPIAQMSMNQAMKAAAFIQAGIDREAAE